MRGRRMRQDRRTPLRVPRPEPSAANTNTLDGHGDGDGENDRKLDASFQVTTASLEEIHA